MSHEANRQFVLGARKSMLCWKVGFQFMLSGTLVTTAALNLFLPRLSRPRFRLFFQTGGEANAVELLLESLPVTVVLSLSAAVDEQKVLHAVKKKSINEKSVGQKQLLPTKSSTITQKSKTKKLTVVASIIEKWKSITERPGFKFRMRLFIFTTIALVATSLVLKQQKKTSIIILTKQWFDQRGFQGTAAFGRSIVYLWGLLVAYPRMLDRQADERKRQRTEKDFERRRQHLHQLAGEVARLRHELTTLDAEIRSFRREIISLKVYAKDDEFETAIEAEMAHLLELRSNTKTALTAAKHAWAEYRFNCVPDVWDDFVVP